MLVFESVSNSSGILLLIIAGSVKDFSKLKKFREEEKKWSEQRGPRVWRRMRWNAGKMLVWMYGAG